MKSVIGPKRGVSAYCYGDLYITSTLEDIMMDMQDMGATGIEILGNGHIDGYPVLTDEWVENWHRLCKKYEIEPVEYGHWIESRMFEHHSLNVLESVEMLERDIKIAARLGFPVLRTKLGVIDGVLTPVTHWREIIARALPVAEQYNVVMCPEIHIPTKLKSKTVDDYVEFIQKNNTKHFGLNIDFGTFQTVFAPDFYAIPEDGKPCSYPRELIPLLPYIYCCHAKFNHIDEAFHETTIPYPEIIQVLVDHRWNGYMLSEYEGPERMNFSQVSDQLRRQHVMGVTAENVADQYGISRAEQDAFSALSQQKCEAAQAAGKFTDEIVSVPIKVKKEVVPFLVDEYPRQGVTAESLAKLSPAFKPDGSVTAANASGINDGAACVIVLSEEKAKQLGVKPLARLVSSASAGVDPSLMGIGPVESTQKALKKAGLSIADIDLFEANEAFAAQCIAVGKTLGFPEEKLNVNGGAIALGHPIGASGCRILVSLLYEMQRRSAKRGLATLCVGGGMGVTTIVESV